MAVEERRRITLRQEIAAALSEEAADTLFELIAPAGEEPATKQHMDRRLDAFEMEVDRRFEQVERRFEQVDHRFDRSEWRVDQRFSEVDQRFAEVNQGIAELGQMLEARISDAITSQTRTLVISQAVLLAAIAALALGLG